MPSLRIHSPGPQMLFLVSIERLRTYSKISGRNLRLSTLLVVVERINQFNRRPLGPHAPLSAPSITNQSQSDARPMGMDDFIFVCSLETPRLRITVRNLSLALDLSADDCMSLNEVQSVMDPCAYRTYRSDSTRNAVLKNAKIKAACEFSLC